MIGGSDMYACHECFIASYITENGAKIESGWVIAKRRIIGGGSFYSF